MTENEAIEAMQFDFKIGGEIHSQVLRNAVDVAIQALETVQKYKDLESELSKRNLTIDHIREYIQFEDECVEMGFTFKSLLEARGKQSRKKPILKGSVKRIVAIDYKNGKGEMKTTDVEFWRCPYCDAVVGERVLVFAKPIDQSKKKYCENCGHRIDWEGIKNE